MSHFTLENYIKKILELKEQAFTHSLDREQLREVAAELGLSDWDYVEARAAGHFKAAQEHLQFRNFAQAISEGEKALEICPYEAKYTFFLAEAYKQNWIMQGESRDRIKSLEYASYCLNQDPSHEGALYLQAALSRPEFEKIEIKTREKTWFKIAVAIIIIFCSAYAGFLGHSLWQAKQASNSWGEVSSIQVINMDKEGVWTRLSEESGTMIRNEVKVDAAGLQKGLTLELDKNIANQGLHINTERIELETFETAYAFRVKGSLESKNKFRKIWLSAEILDKDGMTIKKDLIQVLAKENAHKGSFHHLSHEEEILTEAHTLRIAIESIEL
ncbi:MAG: hypothetical protein JJT94_15045 [Bernardetiaceae bacterium]|nr:hypothetical protein [Bernardetiaceae bacterium]